jgi:hypothetical protein
MRTTAVSAKTSSSPSAQRTTSARSGGQPARPARATASRSTNQRSFSRGASEGRPENTTSKAGRGFSAMKKTIEKNKGAGKEFHDFKVEYDTTYVIAFMEPENYAAIGRHWVNIQSADVRVPRNCLHSPEADEDEENPCPICGIGHVPDAVAFFNVVDLENPTVVQRWEATPGIFNAILEMAETLANIPEKRGGPLDINDPDVYAVVTKKKKGAGKKGFTEYKVNRIKARDLEDDYPDLDVLTDEDREALAESLYTAEDIKFNTVGELEEFVAEEMAD